MTILDALRGEHGVFYAQFDQLDEMLPAARTADEVRALAALLASGLVSHARLEDALLFDRLAPAGADRGLLEALAAEHARIAEALEQAQLAPDTAIARDQLLEAIALARDHFAREERMIFPVAGELLDDAAREALGVRWAEYRAVWLPVAVGGPVQRTR